MWLISCIEPFDAALNLTDSILVVDGNLTDQATGNYINLRNSEPSSSTATSSTFRDINDAKVWVIENGQTQIDLEFFADGTYQFPEGFKAKDGMSYQLYFTLADGRMYESDIQYLKTVAPIKKVYQEFVSEGIQIRDLSAPGHKLYLDMDEPAGKGDAYYWTWKSFEKQDYCAECFGGKYYRETGEPEGSCETDPLLVRYGVTFDYRCERNCWEIIFSNELIATNDAFIDGKSLIGKEVAEIPFYTRYGAVIELKQHAINDQAYKYLKLLIDQNQNSGSLADTPSTALIGNIHSLSNESESVGGYFVLSSVYTVNYFLDRSDGQNISKTVGFEERESNPEPVTADTSRPPLAPCIESPTRTSKEPINWMNS
ncbi:DUF4249 family protein [Jiulongibacter sp. NS-SX5]|uniref:DUF4249 family protein n=1 Tax=Jiulongibacter sp. NS-SX5 TaxID=3463854 RepID=UPI00405A4B2F